MSLKLTWSFNEDNEDSTNVYRSDGPMDPQNLPTPLATVDPGVREYTDDTVVKDGIYYYRFGKVVGGEETLSDEQVALARSYTGPGPQGLESGRYDKLGYFGTLEEDEFLTATELSFLCGLGKNPGHIQNDQQGKWIKVYHDGTVKYIRNEPVKNHISWEELYKAGLVFSGPGDHESEISPEVFSAVGSYEQGVVVTVGLDRFRVRLLKGLPEGGTWSVETNATERNGSEWNEILFPLYAKREVGGLSNTALGAPAMLSPHNVMCQETNGTNVLCGNTVRSTQFTTQGYEYNGDEFWFPVLEYLDS